MTPQTTAIPSPVVLPWPEAAGKDAATTMHLLSGMLQGELRKPQPRLLPLPDGPVHAPTLLSAIGVVAGYAAQCAAAATLAAPGHQRRPGDLTRIGCADGSVLFGGDAITAHLLPAGDGTLALSGFLAGAVVAAGFARADVPDAARMLRHIGQVAGTPAYDVVRAPAPYAPLWDVSGLLRVIWPRARAVLEHSFDPPSVTHRLAVAHWPVAAAIVAQQYIGLGKDIVPPPIAMAIILESALKASRRRLIGWYASPLATQDEGFFARPVS